MKKDIQVLIDQAQEAGAHVRRTGKGHYLVTYQGKFVTTTPGTPSDRRGLLNARAAMRRAGLAVEKGR